MKELKLPKKIVKAIEDFVERLKNVYKDDLVSVILYGSAASGEFAGEHSNINLAILLKDAGLAALARISGTVNKRPFRLLNPVFFTEGYIRSSADVFPIEFLDMKENNILLYGRDVLRDLKIDLRNLRFQCEQELKAKLINIKRLYLRKMDNAALKALLFKSFTSCLHVMRNLLRLKGKTPPYKKEDILKEMAGEFGIDAAVFLKILEAKSGRSDLSYRETEGLFSAFVADLENIIDIIDRL